MRTIILCILFYLLSDQLQAQYQANASTRSITKDIDAITEAKDSPNTAVEQFINLARLGQRNEWEGMLSESFFSQSRSNQDVSRLWEKLSADTICYSFQKEAPANRLNQRTLYYSPVYRSKHSSDLLFVLVKEHGNWKILELK
jgi:hypothetical protein